MAPEIQPTSDLLFAEIEEQTHFLTGSDNGPIKVLIVDDEHEIHRLTRMVLEDFEYSGQCVELISAYNAQEAKEAMLDNEEIALILLDVVMETETSGLDLVRYIRGELNNSLVRIILRTGQPGQAPEREVITLYDINDYKEKTELTSQKLYTAVIASLRNYTDLQTIERNRKEISQKNRLNVQLLDSLPFPAMLLNDAFRVITCNNAASEYGIRPSVTPITGGLTSKRSPWGKLPTNFDLNEPRNWEGEQSDNFFNSHWYPLEDNKYLFYIFDITKQKHDEIERKKFQQLYNQSLRMESVGFLSSGIAHDFNNILAVMIGYAELIQIHTTEENIINNAGLILSAGESGASLARKLLNLTRNDEEEFTQIDIHRTINDAVSLLKSSCKEVSFECRLEATKTVVLGSSSELQNSLINLGVNARDAMPDGGTVSITTELITLTQEAVTHLPHNISVGDYVLLHFTDSGTGIPQEILDRVFEPLFTTKEHGKGTGLGLASVYNCITSHKGIIKIDSKRGLGTTFHIYLPVHTGAPL